MLKDNNNAQLQYRGINEKIIPFYQIWGELLSDKTLDIYQYSILNTLSALRELEEVLEKTLAGLFRTDDNIKACKAEALAIISKDRVMDKHYKAISNRLRCSLGDQKENSIKERAAKNRLLHQVRYVINEIETKYMKNMLAELKTSIDTGDINLIETYANAVASQATYDGWSPRALLELLRFFPMQKEVSLEQQWKNFETSLLNKEKDEYDILINLPLNGQNNINKQNVSDILQNIGLDFLSYDELCKKYKMMYLKDLENLLNKEKRYFRVPVFAYDIYTATHKAIRQISNQLNMASFYNLLGAWDLSSVNIVSINLKSRYHKPIEVKKLYKTYDYFDSSSRVFEQTKKIFTDSGNIQIKEKLKGAFSYANISRASLFQEEKYMNLWIALESLAKTDLYSDIISNVKETVPAAISKRYIYRMVRNYIEDCNRCNVKLDIGNLETVDISQETKQKLVKEVINIFRSKELYEILLKKCECNSLLYYRTETIHQILTEPKVAWEKIHNNHNRVEWHIQRLYRIRNEIAQSALQNDTSLIVYIEHLYDYLSIFIAEIVTYVAQEENMGIEEALSMLKDNYDVFEEYAKGKKQDKEFIQEKVLATGVIELIGTIIKEESSIESTEDVEKQIFTKENEVASDNVECLNN